MTEITQPQNDVVTQAISTLVKGIYEENGYHLPKSGTDWRDAVPPGSLLTFKDELKAAKARMSQQLEILMARVAHHANLVASLVHRLPVEVLAMVFGEFEPSKPHTRGNTSLFDLLLVCRTWYDGIIGSPRLWGWLDAEMPYKIARMVMDRSRRCPIALSWHSFRLPRGSRRLEQFKLLDLAIENSTRIKRVDIHLPRWGPTRPSPRRILEARTPALETLQIRIESYGTNTGFNLPFDQFGLPEGPPLKHLSLRAVATPLDCPRLSNLITLTLSRSSVPRSPEELLQFISSSQQLEVLDIQDVENSHGNIIGEAGESAPVVLQHLKKLVLSMVPSVYIAAILASIYTPSCSHIVVRDRMTDGRTAVMLELLDAVIWRPGNNQAAALTGRPGLEPEKSTLIVKVFLKWIEVESLRSLRGYRRLQFGRTNIPQLMAQLGTAISQLPSPPVLHLHEVNVQARGPTPVDLLPWSEVLESLTVKGISSCRSVLQQLSQRQVVHGTGGCDWVCRKLSSIRLVYGWKEKEDATLDGGALVSLVRERWSGEDGFVATVQPAQFEVSCRKARFENLWSLEAEITRILPSFKLIDANNEI
ncbi:hypothetical protein FS837_001020 [Tulasnella sp. UAMH 9824]|nr:hypothetical protein FS837_001020 [Tulasnella sp. UAMH 9824]